MAGGHVIAKAIYVAAELGIADVLADGPRSAEEVASSTRAHAPSVYRLLRLLAGLGLFEEDGGRFALTPLGAALRTGAPGHARSTVRTFAGPLFWGAFGELLHSVRTGETAFDKVFGKPVFECLAADAEQSTIFNDTMIGFHGDEPPAVAAAYDFSPLRTVVDVGGGTGNLLLTILAAYPGLAGTLFDQPHVAVEARRAVDARGLSDRCEVVEGSFLGPLPPGRDAYLLSHIIHDWNEPICLAILQRCRDAMPATGRLLIVEQVIPPGSGFHPGKFLDLVMLTIPGGMERTADQYGELLSKARFKMTRVVPTASAVSVVEAQPV
jgi:hypothetical protein